MKKLILCTIMLSLFFSAFCSIHSADEEAMGNVGIVVNTRRNTFFFNPASLYFYKSKNVFIADISYYDDLFTEKGFEFPSQPEIYLDGLFVGKNVSLGVELDFKAFKTYKEPENYRVQKDASIDVVFALGWKVLGGGIGIRAGSGRYKDTVISEDHRTADLIQDGLLSRLPRQADMTYLKVRAGFGAYWEGFSAGILLEDFVDTQKTEVGESHFSFKRLKDSLGVGIGYEFGEFSRHGRVRPVIFSIDGEVWNVLSENRILRAGADLTFQLSRSFNISLRGGVQMPFNNIESSSSTFGFEFEVGAFDIYINAVVPFSRYASETYYDNIPFTLGCTYSR